MMNLVLVVFSLGAAWIGCGSICCHLGRFVVLGCVLGTDRLDRPGLASMSRNTNRCSTPTSVQLISVDGSAGALSCLRLPRSLTLKLTALSSPIRASILFTLESI